jgi:S-adenosylmethionine-dependent methyltransferase
MQFVGRGLEMTGPVGLFDRNVERWRLYTESVKGRLLHELALHHLEQQLGSTGEPMRVLDAGCGLGDVAFALALFCRTGRLVLLDFSEKMIEGAKERLTAHYPAIDRERIKFVNAALEELEFDPHQGSFDLIVCHNTLEYTREPRAALASLVKRLVPGGLLSLVVANRFSEPLKLALGKFDLAGARLALHKRNSTADLFDHAPKHTFSLEEIEEMAAGMELKVAGRHGIRIFTDYLPESLIEDAENFQMLLGLEKEAASEVPYIHVARYLQIICKK